MAGQIDRQTLFHRILPATARGLTSTTTVDYRLAFKSQRCGVQCESNQKLLHHIQHAKNQLNSYTHS